MLRNILRIKPNNILTNYKYKTFNIKSKKFFLIKKIMSVLKGEFEFLHEGDTVKVNKQDLYNVSKKFQTSDELMMSESYEFKERISTGAFDAFIKFIKGGKIAINEAIHAFELMRLAEEWGIDELMREAIEFSQGKVPLIKVIDELISSNNKKYTYGLKQILASQLDTVVMMGTFQKLDLDIRISILGNPNRSYSDYKVIFEYTYSLIEDFPDRANEIASTIDLRCLNVDELGQLVKNNNLRFKSEKVISPFTSISQKIDLVSKKIDDLSDYKDLVQSIASKCKENTQIINKNQDALQKLEDKAIEKMEEVNKNISTLEKRIKSSTKKANADIKTLTDTMHQIENTIEQELLEADDENN